MPRRRMTPLPTTFKMPPPSGDYTPPFPSRPAGTHGGAFFIPVLPEQRQVCSYFKPSLSWESSCEACKYPGSEVACAYVSLNEKPPAPVHSGLRKKHGKGGYSSGLNLLRQRRKTARRERRKERTHMFNPQERASPLKILYRTLRPAGTSKSRMPCQKQGIPIRALFTGGHSPDLVKRKPQTVAESQFPLFFTWSGHGTELPSGAPSSLPFL